MSHDRHNEARSSPRVLVVGHDSLARARLVALVSTLSDAELVGQAAAADDAASTLDAFNPDIALWDLGWTPSIAFERLTEYSEAEVSVVALVSHEEHASRARASGARGVLARDVDAASLQAALTAVAQGMVVLDPELTPAVRMRPRVMRSRRSPAASSRSYASWPRDRRTRPSPTAWTSASTR